MFKKLLIALIMLGLIMVGSAAATEGPAFTSFYGPHSKCFMTMENYYENNTSPAWICSKTTVIVATAHKSFVVFFDFDSDKIDKDQVVILEDALVAMNDSKSPTFSLTGFCDFRGSNDYNTALGSRRIESVRSWFVKNGVDKEFVIVNHGKNESPIRELAGRFCSDCWNDRRVEIGVE